MGRTCNGSRPTLQIHRKHSHPLPHHLIEMYSSQTQHLPAPSATVQAHNFLLFLRQGDSNFHPSPWVWGMLSTSENGNRSLKGVLVSNYPTFIIQIYFILCYDTLKNYMLFIFDLVMNLFSDVSFLCSKYLFLSHTYFCICFLLCAHEIFHFNVCLKCDSHKHCKQWEHKHNQITQAHKRIREASLTQ